MTDTIRTGGCQCGAVRFRVSGETRRPSICHCRMCQKAFGGFFAPLADIGDAALEWTRGEPRRFQSSSHVQRGFCAECGTPLTYEAPDGVALAIGAFDDPASLPPLIQFGTEDKLPFVDTLHRLPARTTGEDVAENPFLADIQSYQHPDHDTVR